MRAKLLIGSLLIVVLGSLSAAPAPEEKDLEKIQGTWKLESVESQGQLLIEQYKDWTFNIKDDKLTIKIGERVHNEYTIKIDPNKKPKTIDLIRKNGDQTLTETGIYELDGDTWKVCNDDSGATRPTEYGTKEGSRLELIMMKRVKQ
jgi:uncharacterized protein (TIGR03067 family)